MEKQLVGVNEDGLRIGENHPNATLTDQEVSLIRELSEGGMSYAAIAEKFECSKSTVQMICQYLRRAQTPSRWKVLTRETPPSTTEEPT